MSNLAEQPEMELDMRNAENANHIESPDDLLNVRNVAAGGDALIVHEGGDEPITNDSVNLTNRVTILPPPKSARLPNKAEAAGKRAPIEAQPKCPVHRPSNRRLERMLANNEVTPLDMLDTEETYIDCPWCNKRTLTTVRRQSGATTADYACRLLCTTLIFFFIPYLFNCCQDIAHYCSECGHAVAVQQYVYYQGAEGQQPTLFLPPRPKVVPTRHAGSPSAALPKTLKAQPQEIETRHLQEVESRQPQEMESRHLQEMESRHLQEMESRHLQEIESNNLHEMESRKQPQERKPRQAQDIHHRPKHRSSI